MWSCRDNQEVGLEANGWSCHYLCRIQPARGGLLSRDRKTRERFWSASGWCTFGKCALRPTGKPARRSLECRLRPHGCSAPSGEPARFSRLSKRPHPLVSRLGRLGVGEWFAVLARQAVPWFQSRPRPRWCTWSVASESANHPTRLVTRTK